MSMIPPLPSWEAAHPMVVHVPLALLMLAWVPMVVGLVDFRRRWVWMSGALLTLVIGTAGAFVAVVSGEATEEVAVVTTQTVERLVHEHEEMGELARTMFVVATGVFVVVLGMGAGMKKGRGRAIAVGVGAVVFLGVYGYAGTRLAWAGHMGAELVHAHGVRAPMAPSEPGAGGGAPVVGEHADDD